MTVDTPKTKQLATKFKAMGLESVLVITGRNRREPVPGCSQPAKRAGRRALLRRSVVAGLLQEGHRHEGRSGNAEGMLA